MTFENKPTTETAFKADAVKSDAVKSDAAKKESFGDLVRKVALASVGGVVLLQEEMEEFVSKLVQKGELAEKDGKSLVKDLLEKRKQARETPATPEVAEPPAVATPALHPFGASAAALTSAIDMTVDKVLHRINVPTKADVDELSKKIDDIDKKLEALALSRRSA